MGYERYPRGTNPQGDYYGRRDPQDYGRDYGSGRDYSYSSARDYDAAGYGRDRDDDDRYGLRDYGNAGYGQRDRQSYGQQYGQSGRYGQQDRYGQSQRYGQGQWDRGGQGGYHGSYASDGRRFEDVGARRNWDDDDRYGRNREMNRDRGQRGAPQGYDADDRGFFQRAGDEVRSWFGDEEAERRREADMRYDEQNYGSRYANDRDSDYGSWRSSQIAALDRDYDEYRRENRSKFENEFSSWRSGRQTQRDSLSKVDEHMDVVGSDGSHVGTVDKVRGDRILLTKNDADAGGRHHSIPSSWIQSVEDKVTLTKTAEEAKKQWRDEERNSAMFNYGDNASSGDGKDTGRDSQGRMLNRSFSGTY